MADTTCGPPYDFKITYILTLPFSSSSECAHIQYKDRMIFCLSVMAHFVCELYESLRT